MIFHIQKGHPQETYQWWISWCNPQTIAVGKRTMKLQCDSIIQDYYQWMTADEHLRASDEHGQQWKLYLIKKPVTEGEGYSKQKLDKLDKMWNQCFLHQQWMPVMVKGLRGRRTRDHQNCKKLNKNRNFTIYRTS